MRDRRRRRRPSFPNEEDCLRLCRRADADACAAADAKRPLFGLSSFLCSLLRRPSLVFVLPFSLPPPPVVTSSTCLTVYLRQLIDHVLVRRVIVEGIDRTGRDHKRPSCYPKYARPIGGGGTVTVVGSGLTLLWRFGQDVRL